MRQQIDNAYEPVIFWKNAPFIADDGLLRRFDCPGGRKDRQAERGFYPV
jgi:hypothetical protein